MLAPGDGRTHHAYLWAYASGAFEDLRAVVYDFTISRSGEHARAFLGDWRGNLVCDEYSAYKASFALGVTGRQVHGASAAQVLRTARYPQEHAAAASLDAADLK